MFRLIVINFCTHFVQAYHRLLLVHVNLERFLLGFLERFILGFLERFLLGFREP